MDRDSSITTLDALPVLVGDPAIQWGDLWKRVARVQLEHAGLTFTTLNVCRVKDRFGRNNPVCLFITVDEPESADFIRAQHAIQDACLQAVETWPREEIQVVIQHGKGIRFCSDQGSLADQRDTLMAMGQTITTETAMMEHFSTTLTCAISIRPHQGEPYTAWLGVHHGTSKSNEPVTTGESSLYWPRYCLFNCVIGVQVLCPSNTTRKNMVEDDVMILGAHQETEAMIKNSLEREMMRLRDGDLQREPEHVKQSIQRLEEKLKTYQQAIVKTSQRLEWVNRESALWRCGSIERTSGLDQRTAIDGSMDWAVIRPSDESFVGVINVVRSRLDLCADVRDYSKTSNRFNDRGTLCSLKELNQSKISKIGISKSIDTEERLA